MGSGQSDENEVGLELMLCTVEPTPESNTIYTLLVEKFALADSIGYGESAVSEQEHALQCAELADAAGADEDLVMASLLHDVARFAVPQEMVLDTLQNTETHGDAKTHGEQAAHLLGNLLSERALFCIRHHAEAKQYLCQINPAYRAKLADASIATLRIQARQTSPQKLAELSRHRWWKDALRVRAWDDAGKVKGRQTRPVDYWLDRLKQFAAAD